VCVFFGVCLHVCRVFLTWLCGDTSWIFSRCVVLVGGVPFVKVNVSSSIVLEVSSSFPFFYMLFLGVWLHNLFLKYNIYWYGDVY
jgi:hypothetical protein